MYGSSAAPPAEDQDAGLDVWGFLRRRKSFIIVLAVLGTGIGYMMFHRQVPIYDPLRSCRSFIEMLTDEWIFLSQNET